MDTPKTANADYQLSLERAVQHRRLHAEVKRIRRSVEESRRMGALLGLSVAMRGVTHRAS